MDAELAGASDLQDWVERAPGARISLRDVTDALGPRAHGLLLLILALPNVTVIPSVPFLPFACGIPAMAICWQMARGTEAPALPAWASRLSLGKEAANLVAVPVSWLAGCCKPRYPWMSGGPGRVAAAATAALLTFLTCLPTPVLNTCPALGMLVMAVGLAEEDGVVTAAGAAFGLLGYVGTLALLHFLVDSASRFA